MAKTITRNVPRDEIQENRTRRRTTRNRTRRHQRAENRKFLQEEVTDGSFDDLMDRHWATVVSMLDNVT